MTSACYFSVMGKDVQPRRLTDLFASKTPGPAFPIPMLVTLADSLADSFAHPQHFAELLRHVLANRGGLFRPLDCERNDLLRLFPRAFTFLDSSEEIGCDFERASRIDLAESFSKLSRP
jgi:hypothetical protein